MNVTTAAQKTCQGTHRRDAAKRNTSQRYVTAKNVWGEPRLLRCESSQTTGRSSHQCPCELRPAEGGPVKQAHARNAWALLCIVGFIAFYATRGSPWLSQLIWAGLGLGSAAIVTVVAGRRRVFARSAWLLVAAAMTLTVLINGIRAAASISPRTASNTSVAYGISLTIVFSLLTVAAYLLVNRHRRTAADSSGIVDAAIVFVAASMVATDFLVFPFWSDPALNTAERMGLLLFDALNVLLLSLTVRLWFSTERSVNRASRVLAVGFIAMIFAGGLGLAEFLPVQVIDPELGRNLIFGFSMIFFAVSTLAALDSTANRPPAADIDAGVAARTRVLTLMALCVLVPPVLLLVSGAKESSFTTSRVFVLLTLVLTALLILRVNLLIQSYRDAVHREHVLREINAGLMRAADLSEVNGRLSDWASRLVEQNEVTCLLGTAEELASVGLGPFGGRFRLPNGSVRHRTVVSIPGSQPARRLVVDSPEIVSSPAQASLAVLGQSLGMALERLALSRRVVERATTERLQLLLHNASDVIALVDEQGKIRYVTEAIRDLTEQSPTDVLASSWTKLFQDPALARGLLERARAVGEAKGDLVMSRARPSDLPSDIVRPAATETAPVPDRRVEVDISWLAAEEQYVVTHHDVTDRYVLEQQLAYQAFHDELTGLNNRAVFRKELARAAARSRRSGKTFAVMMIDLDDFKNINDSLGHPAGDELLRVVADRLVECMREGDTPVRLGGDEFAVILESARSAEDADAVAKRVLEQLSQPMTLRGTEIVIGSSIGIAVSDGTADPADVERDADIALYDAKFAGKGQVAMFHTDMHDSAVQRLSLTNQLRGALDRGEITVSYQPIVDLGSMAVVGAEALVRWQHPTRGELAPGTFIGLAESTGSIVEIGRFVMERALRDAASWALSCPGHERSRIALNISGRQLQSDDVAAVLRDLLAETGVDPQRVVVEVTESVLMPNDGVAAAQLREVAELGVSVFIDDFGTGWASLQYLRSLPVSGLKLAQEFVAGLPNDFDFGLAQAIRELSQSMHLSEVIAEGIETQEQLDSLLNMGYRLGQGFLMHEPMPFTDLVTLLGSTPTVGWELGQRTDLASDEAAARLSETPVIVPSQLSLRSRSGE